ncbi:MAG: hypothetical protein HQ559_01600 [Lentisphaerae bacterium]|nr:hypothetical protein [Lentisphaerota bacterium]
MPTYREEWKEKRIAQGYSREPYTKFTCTVCKKKPALFHYPYIEDAQNTYAPLVACWDCFGGVFAGER